MLARKLFEQDVLLAEADPASFEGVLFPSEEAQITAAVEKRRREFVTGRSLARRLLPMLGIEDAVIVNGADRAPLWPTGAVGSISHTRGYCGVVIASSNVYAALGLDVEQADPLRAPLVRSITRAEERVYLDGLPEVSRFVVAKAIFSAKEAAYKAQYVLSQTFLGFSAMRIEFDDVLVGGADPAPFRAIFMEDAGEVFRVGDVLRGSVRIDEGLVCCGVSIRPGATFERAV
jgi:4'-phosphopantetheinyl transferase EntD